MLIDNVNMSDEAPRGRPSKYKPEYCSQLIEHMSSGLSFESFAAVIKVNQDTLHEWVKVHPDFSESKKEAYAQNLLFWEKIGQQGMSGEIEGFNATVWIFSMKNRHKWRDKQPEEVDTVINNTNNVGTVTVAEVDAKLKKLREEEVK